jgi:glycerol-3-phosphate dehydrogenase (NAD(P)+)
LESGLVLEPDLNRAVAQQEVLVMAVPSSAYREICCEIKPVVGPDVQIVSTAKGFEDGTLLRMTQVVADELGAIERVAVLSGPSFAKEVLSGLPTAIVMAASKQEVADSLSPVFHFANMRVYASDDPVGVEAGGAVKNVIALAAGIVDGAGMGSNARAALMTRGLAELQRLVIALGGQPLTVSGLSGLGDLLLTATGDLSRNRQVGLRLGQGESLKSALEAVGQVVEGVVAASKVKALGDRLRVELPITEQVNSVLNGEVSVADAVKNLLSRRRKAEFN